MADDISAKKTAKAAKGDTDTTAQEEQQQHLEDLLEQEMRAAHPTVVIAKKLVTNIDTITHSINGQTIEAPTGRGFVISDKRYENTFSYIFDAVGLTPEGEIASITLFDIEAQEFKTFRKRKKGETEIVDSVYEQILLAEAFAQLTGSPGARPQDKEQTDEEITNFLLKFAKDDIESSTYSVEPKDMETADLRKQMLDLQNHIRNLNGRLDRIYSKFATEGKSLSEANRDDKVKELKQMISAITRLANDRRVQLLQRSEKLALDLKTLTDRVEELQQEVDSLTFKKDGIQQQVDATRETLNSGVFDAKNNLDDAREVAKAQKFLEQATQVLSYLSKKIEEKSNQINQYCLTSCCSQVDDVALSSSCEFFILNCRSYFTPLFICFKN